MDEVKMEIHDFGEALTYHFVLPGIGDVIMRQCAVGPTVARIDFLTKEGRPRIIPEGITVMNCSRGFREPELHRPHNNGFFFPVEGHIKLFYKDDLLFETQPSNQNIVEIHFQKK